MTASVCLDSPLVLTKEHPRPLFLIIDNLQWMDVMSVRLAIEIARSAPKVCILTATRPLCPPIPFEVSVAQIAISRICSRFAFILAL